MSNKSLRRSIWLTDMAQLVGCLLGAVIGGVLALAIGVLVLFRKMEAMHATGDQAIGVGVFALVPIPFGAILGGCLGCWIGLKLAQKYQRGPREK